MVCLLILIFLLVVEKETNPCLQPARQGRCRGLIPRFYFDAKTNECKSFKYGGCGGNGNNFKTVEECETACKK